MKLLAFTISFAMAFLLFSVQPMATKMVLPMLGGTPAVWNTAMLTFQLLLLAGYGYAHVLSRHVAARHQWMVHAGLIAISCIYLPLHIVLTNGPELVEQPIRHLVGAFVLQVGLPFFVLSATAPLLQSWVSRSAHPLSQTPYVLYSASNLGSMMGLLGYVILIEPNLTLQQQSQYWSVLYIAGAVALLAAVILLKPAPVVVEEHATPVTFKRMLFWVWLAFLPSSLSLSVTSYITTDIAAMPLFWVVPLALYLLSFVDAFRTKPLLVKGCIYMAPRLGMAALLIYGLGGHRYAPSFLFQLLSFFVLAVALHGWLARCKPISAQLTQFYFCLSIGGALGGVLNALVAPIVFTETLEYPLSLIAASMTMLLLWSAQKSRVQQRILPLLRTALWATAIMALITVVFYLLMAMGSDTLDKDLHHLNGGQLLAAGCFGVLIAALRYRSEVGVYTAAMALGVVMIISAIEGMNADYIYRGRSFFGVWKVFERPEDHARMLMHNTTVHSAQYLDLKGKPELLSYYYSLKESYNALPVMRRNPIAVMGLGAGTLKCLAVPKQQVDLFEIDPLVVGLAEDRHMFYFLSRCPGTHAIKLGDGRIMLGQQPEHRYGSIILDAFSSDSIPTHLMTLEALKTYQQKLVPHGVILLHITNRHVNLEPLLGAQADALGFVAYSKTFFPAEDQKLLYKSTWVIMARDESDLQALVRRDGWHRLVPDEGARPWTDDFVNLMPYFNILRREH